MRVKTGNLGRSWKQETGKQGLDLMLDTESMLRTETKAHDMNPKQKYMKEELGHYWDRNSCLHAVRMEICYKTTL